MKTQKGFIRHHLESGFIQIILILVLVFAAIGGAYYFGTVNNKSSSSNMIVTPTPVASTQATSDQTASWKTYTSRCIFYNKSAQSIEIRFPNSWQLVQNKNGTKVSFKTNNESLEITCANTF